VNGARDARDGAWRASEVPVVFVPKENGNAMADVALGDPPPIQPLARAGAVTALFAGVHEIAGETALALLTHPVHATWPGEVRLVVACKDGRRRELAAARVGRSSSYGVGSELEGEVQPTPLLWIVFSDRTACAVATLELRAERACAGAVCAVLELSIPRAALRAEPWPRSHGP
jgi:hypothetical protein